MNTSASMIVLLAMLVLEIFSIFGLYNLTRFAFNNTRNGNQRTIELSNNEILVAKISVVLQWVAVGLTIMGVLYQSGVRM